MEQVVTADLSALKCSEVYLREKTVISVIQAYKSGRAHEIPPIKIYRHPESQDYVIWDGNTRAFVARSLGRQTIPAVLVPEGAEGREEVLKGYQEARTRGIRGLEDLNPYDVLTEDRWRYRPV